MIVDETPQEEDLNAPKSEPVGDNTPPEEDKSTAELLREELSEFRKTMKEEAIAAVREEIASASKPVRDKVPAPEVKRETTARDAGIRVTGHGTDMLYRSRPIEEQRIRNRHVDGLIQSWLMAKRDRDFETLRGTQRELNDLTRATDDVLEGAAGASGAIGSGTGADAIPVPLASVISLARDKRARIRQRAQIFSTPNQSLRVTIGETGTASMVGEGATVANTAAGLSTVLLTKKKLQSKFSLSREMMADSAFNLVNTFIAKGGSAMGRVEDEQFARDGDATGNNITQAIEYAPGVNWVQPRVAGEVGYPDIVALTFAPADQDTENGTYFANKVGLKLLSTILDGNKRPIFTPGAGLAAPNVVGEQVPGAIGMLFGNRPVIELPLSSSGTVADAPEVDIWFGDLNEYAILDDGGITVDFSEHVRFEDDMIVWKLTERIDGAVLQPHTFSRLVGVSGVEIV